MKATVTILIVTLLIVLCTTSKIISEEKINDKTTLLISKMSYKLKRKPFHELTGKLTHSLNNVTVYWITSVCNCIRKEERKIPRMQYKIVPDSNYDLELTSNDKIVLQKFRFLPETEMFCSTSLLDSAKGFILLKKK